MKLKKITCIILSVFVFFSLSNQYSNHVTYAKETMQIRACWISFLDFEKYLKDLNEDEFTQKVSNMYDNVLKYKFNTVIVHCRAMGDAMYPSQIFPWSIYISSDRTAPGYDPIKIMISLAHEKGLRFEAWINPYRISRDAETTEGYFNTEYYDKYKHLFIEYNNLNDEKCLVLDPAKDETVELITEGVVEIVKNYDIDGIHFDDYFYVDGMCDDLDVSIKKENINRLIKNVYSKIKETKPECTFGISPAGNLENAKKQGADIETWLSSYEYIDYIMPQIYWSDTYITEDEIIDMFSIRSKEWTDCNIIDIPLYVGLALYKVDEPSNKDVGWTQKDNNIMKQYEMALSMGYDGYGIFRYEWLEKQSATNELNNLCNYLNGLNVPDLIYSEKKQNSGTNTRHLIKVYGVGAAFTGIKSR